MKAIISQCENLTGRVRSEIQLVGAIRSEGKLVGRLSKPVGYDTYDGSYEVTPKCESQTMNTNNKLMKKDVTIQPIPCAEVTNPAGGKTMIIG